MRRTYVFSILFVFRFPFPSFCPFFALFIFPALLLPLFPLFCFFLCSSFSPLFRFFRRSSSFSPLFRFPFPSFCPFFALFVFPALLLPLFPLFCFFLCSSFSPLFRFPFPSFWPSFFVLSLFPVLLFPLFFLFSPFLFLSLVFFTSCYLRIKSFFTIVRKTIRQLYE